MPSWPLFLLALAAALLTMGGPCYPPPEGLNSLATTSDNALVVQDNSEWGGSQPYQSRDGGYSWQAGRTNHGWTSLSKGGIVAPGGDSYIIEGNHIVRVSNGEREGVYDAGYLRDRANLVLQYRATGERELTKAPKSIIHDPASGNLVVAMGYDGVVVGTPEGAWERVAVGTFRPTDFSALGRLRLLATKPGFWIGTLALVMSLVGICTILAQCGWEELTRAIIILAVSIGVEALLFLWAFTVGVGDKISEGPLYLAFVLFAIAIATSYVLLLVWPAEDSRRRSLALALSVAVAVSYALGFPFFFTALLEGVLLVPITIAAILLLISALPYWSQGEQSRIAFWTACAVLAALLLPIILWLLYLIPEWAAISMGLVLGISAALIMFDYLNGWKWWNQLMGRPESQALDMETND